MQNSTNHRAVLTPCSRPPLTLDGAFRRTRNPFPSILSLGRLRPTDLTCSLVMLALHSRSYATLSPTLSDRTLGQHDAKPIVLFLLRPSNMRVTLTSTAVLQALLQRHGGPSFLWQRLRRWLV